MASSDGISKFLSEIQSNIQKPKQENRLFYRSGPDTNVHVFRLIKVHAFCIRPNNVWCFNQSGLIFVGGLYVNLYCNRKCPGMRHLHSGSNTFIF